MNPRSLSSKMIFVFTVGLILVAAACALGSSSDDLELNLSFRLPADVKNMDGQKSRLNVDTFHIARRICR